MHTHFSNLLDDSYVQTYRICVLKNNASGHLHIIKVCTKADLIPIFLVYRTYYVPVIHYHVFNQAFEAANQISMVSRREKTHL